MTGRAAPGWCGIAAAGLALLGSCAHEVVVPRVVRGPTMGTTYEIKWVGSVDESVVKPIVKRVLEEIDAAFSAWTPRSELSRFNDYGAGVPFQASRRFVALIARSLKIARATDGAFDPTVGSLVDARGFGPGDRRPQPAGAIAAARGTVGYLRIAVLDETCVQKQEGAGDLDLNAIAQGYSVDRVAAALRAAGVTSFMVEIGGEVLCAGSKAPGVPWRIGIESPVPGELLAAVELCDMALATSGTYRNRIPGVGHHIVDPRTGKNPDNAVVSVSVRAPDCALADALATAFVVLGSEPVPGVLDRLGIPPDRVGVLFLLESGKVRRVRW